MRTSQTAAAAALAVVAALIYMMFGSATGSILPWQGEKSVTDAQLVNGIAIAFAAFLSAAAVGLLRDWRHGIRIGRMAALVVAGFAAYLIWWVLFVDTSTFRSYSVIFYGGLSVVLLVVAAGVLYALRGRRPDLSSAANPRS